ncbi:uncharacterized protein LOC120325286 [Pipra filicauda]|uniref:Uncharacterized protein LOC120325286 n=1 Tax=Pipra filicauda TaxID=649802 RepID=A0A7R5L8J6_9PASS|nr:uncharacterized protein LOC120325286 [Pipra filicauda]
MALGMVVPEGYVRCNRSPEPRVPPTTVALTAAALSRDRYRAPGGRQGQAGSPRERHLRRCGPEEAAGGLPAGQARVGMDGGDQGPGATQRSRSRSHPRFSRHSRVPHVPLAEWRGVAWRGAPPARLPRPPPGGSRPAPQCRGLPRHLIVAVAAHAPHRPPHRPSPPSPRTGAGVPSIYGPAAPAPACLLQYGRLRAPPPRRAPAGGRAVPSWGCCGVFNMAGTESTTFLHEAQCNVTQRCGRQTTEEKDRAQRSPAVWSPARGPRRCCAAAGVVNQAVTSRRTATSQHQGCTAPQFDRQLERSLSSCGQAGDVEHLLAASTQAQTCKGNQVLNSYLGTSLPLKSEIEVRPLNISVGLAPRPCLAGQCRAVLQQAQGSTVSNMVPAPSHAV